MKESAAVKDDNNANRIIAITENGLNDLVDRAAEVAAITAIKKMEEEQKTGAKKKKDRRLHNTELLLRNYQMLKYSIEDSVYSMNQSDVGDILDMMMNRDNNDDFIIQSISESRARTIMIVEHIDTMLEVYRLYCQVSSSGLDERRYNILYDRYLAEGTLSVKEIRDKYNISKELVYSDLKIAKERLSALIFGIDGLTF